MLSRLHLVRLGQQEVRCTLSRFSFLLIFPLDLRFPPLRPVRATLLTHSLYSLSLFVTSVNLQWYNSKEGHHQTHLEEEAAEHAAKEAKLAKAAKEAK